MSNTLKKIREKTRTWAYEYDELDVVELWDEAYAEGFSQGKGEIERLRSASVSEKADAAYITSLVKQLNDKQNEIERLREQECQQHNYITGLLREIERLTETLAAAQAALTEQGDEMVNARTEMRWLQKHNADLAAEIERLLKDKQA